MNQSTSADVVLEAQHVSVTYGEGSLAVHALSDASFHVRRGEVVVIMGPSGSGKTTLLSALGLLLTPSSGRILLNGQDLGRASATARANARLQQIGFVFQQFNLLASLTATDNVALPMLLAGVATDERTRRAREVLAHVEMLDRALAKPRALSGGQQQRVAIARALANAAPVLLCDEPTAALDSTTGASILNTLRTLAARARQAVVIVTHDARVLSIADRVYEVTDGRVSEAPVSAKERSPRSSHADDEELLERRAR